LGSNSNVSTPPRTRQKTTTTMAATYFPISEISAYQTKWTIRARVTSKAPLRTFAKKFAGGGEGKVFHVDLVDGPNGEIRASFFNDAATKFADMLEVGKTYTFSRGNVKVANKQFNSCSHRYEIAFERDAEIAECATSVENFAVSFKFSDLRSVQSKQLPCRVDLCGVITSFKPIQTIVTKADGRELLKRDITIADDTATSMEVTLWGDKAKLPDADFEGNPVVGLKAILLKEFNGGRNGSSVESTSVVFRPEAPEAQRIQSWWSEGGSSQQLTSLRGVGGGGGAARNAEHGSVAEMRRKAERVGDQMEHYSFTGRLALVQTRKQGEEVPLHYLACGEPKEGNGLPCNRRVDGSGFCAACNRAGKTNIRLTARCRFVDYGDSVWLTSFHEPAEAIVGMTGDKLAALDGGAGGREKLEAALRGRCFLEPLEVPARAKLDTYQGEVKPNVTCVAAAPVNRSVRGRKMLAEIQVLLAAA